MASDKSNYFTFENKVCPICKGLAQHQRDTAARDRSLEENLKNAPPLTPRPGDGRRLFVRQLNPLEVQQRREGRRGGQK